MKAMTIHAIVLGGAAAIGLSVAASAQTPYDKDLPRDAKSVYTKTCSFCHDDGLLGAPIIGDKKAWAEILTNGRNSMYEEVLDGTGHMPARRNRRGYSDEDLKRAVDYLINNSR